MTRAQLVAEWHADAKTLPQWGAEPEAREVERCRLHAERMYATVPVGNVLVTDLIDKAVRALLKAAA